MCVVDALPAGFTGGCIGVSRCINACDNCWFWRICVRLMRAPTHGVGWILFAFIVLSWRPLLCTSHGNIDFKTSINICRLWESSSKRRMLTERTLKKTEARLKAVIPCFSIAPKSGTELWSMGSGNIFYLDLTRICKLASLRRRPPITWKLSQVWSPIHVWHAEILLEITSNASYKKNKHSVIIPEPEVPEVSLKDIRRCNVEESKGLLSWDFESSSGSRSRRRTHSRLQLKNDDGDDDDGDCDAMPQAITVGNWGGLEGW